MLDDRLTAQILVALVQQMGLIIVVALLLSRIPAFARLVRPERSEPEDSVFPATNQRLKDPMAILVPSLALGCLGIVGTYTGVPVQGALANARMIPVFVGGLLGGPAVGILSGLIAGTHRWLIDIGGFTAVACMISTVAEGILGGMLSPRFHASGRKARFALAAGASAEGLQMLIILAVARPFREAVSLVSVISIPMIVANGLGVSLIIVGFENLLNEGERRAARLAQQVLRVADKTVTVLRQGLDQKSAAQTAQIIHKEMGLAAVAVTDTERILVHVGLGSDHHEAGSSLMTRLTREVLESGKPRIAVNADEIGCSHQGCPLKSAVIVPLLRENACIGTLKLYRTGAGHIGRTEAETAQGLAGLISAQLELSRIEEQKKQLRRAELHALQAQINPHFLFNAINTIVSLVRTNPQKGRELLVALASFYRSSLHSNALMIPLEQELQHVRSYLQIESARFGERLEVHYQIEEGVNVMVPPLLLQPLVENAVLHGILPLPSGGRITIGAKSLPSGTQLWVHDEGKGFDGQPAGSCPDPEEERGLGPENTASKSLKSQMGKSKKDSIGLNNIRARLWSAYGPEASLSFDCAQGTYAKILIPKHEGDGSE